MTIFRWFMGIVGSAALIGWLVTLALYVFNGDDRFKELGTRLRQLFISFALFWFNLEIWGRVLYTIFTW